MSNDKTPVKNFTAWIVVSSLGLPAPAFGLAFTRKELLEICKRSNRPLDEAGYRPCRVRISPTDDPHERRDR
jgi:hypothetical protein